MRVDHIDLADIAYHTASNCHIAKIHLVGPDTDITLDCAAFLLWFARSNHHQCRFCQGSPDHGIHYPKPEFS
jgi:hypothetical protein